MYQNPCIGVSMNYQLTPEGCERAYIDGKYLDFLSDFGSCPMPVAPTDEPDQLETVLDHLDGILFTGGLDLDPSLWNEKPHEKTILIHPRRQKCDFALYQAALNRQIPIMAICLGIQMINVAHGGALFQHLPDDPGTIDHGGENSTTDHLVKICKNTKLFDWINAEQITIKSAHHQGVDLNRLGRSLLPAAVACDNVVEALEKPDYPFLIAVQWHPEAEPSNPLNLAIINNFLAAAKTFHENKSRSK